MLNPIFIEVDNQSQTKQEKKNNYTLEQIICQNETIFVVDEN